jgi:hypothetical protein
MKIIKYFKLFESRTSELSEQEFFKILRDNCKEFIKDPKLLQRAKQRFDSQYSYINPKSFEREPLLSIGGNTAGVSSKHHTLLMDNLPSWSKFPKRSKSIIGSVGVNENTCFGQHTYIVIPFDGAEFAMTPGSDLWDCHVDLNNDFSDYKEEYRFDNVFSEVFKSAKISDNSYKEMIVDLQNLYDEWLVNKEYMINGDRRIPLKIRVIFANMVSDSINDVDTALNKYFDYKNFTNSGTSSIRNNRFEIVSYNQLSISYQNREFWTESECLMFYIGYIDDENYIENKYKQFIQRLKESQD